MDGEPGSLDIYSASEVPDKAKTPHESGDDGVYVKTEGQQSRTKRRRVTSESEDGEHPISGSKNHLSVSKAGEHPPSHTHVLLGVWKNSPHAADIDKHLVYGLQWKNGVKFQIVRVTRDGRVAEEIPIPAGRKRRVPWVKFPDIILDPNLAGKTENELRVYVAENVDVHVARDTLRWEARTAPTNPTELSERKLTRHARENSDALTPDLLDTPEDMSLASKTHNASDMVEAEHDLSNSQEPTDSEYEPPSRRKDGPTPRTKRFRRSSASVFSKNKVEAFRAKHPAVSHLPDKFLVPMMLGLQHYPEAAAAFDEDEDEDDEFYDVPEDHKSTRDQGNQTNFLTLSLPTRRAKPLSVMIEDQRFIRQTSGPLTNKLVSATRTVTSIGDPPMKCYVYHVLEEVEPNLMTEINDVAYQRLGNKLIQEYGGELCVEGNQGYVARKIFEQIPKTPSAKGRATEERASEGQASEGYIPEAHVPEGHVAEDYVAK
jgi:hypothetical protein